MKDPERLNYVRFNESGEKFEGNIASLEFDEDIRGVKLESSNIGAPAYRVYGKTPKDQEAEIGAVCGARMIRGRNTFRCPFTCEAAPCVQTLANIRAKPMIV